MKNGHILNALKRLLGDIESVQSLYERMCAEDFREHIKSVPLDETALSDFESVRERVEHHRFVVDGNQVTGGNVSSVLQELINEHVDTVDLGPSEALLQQLHHALFNFHC